MSKIKVTIGISNRNRAWFLDRSIYLISKQTLSQDDFELIIVDDGSIDESEQIIQKYKDMNIIKNFHYIKNTQKRHDLQGGASRTTNMILKTMEGDYVLHTCPEIMPLPDWAEQHYIAHEGTTDKCVFGHCLHPREYHIITVGQSQIKGSFLGNSYTDYNWQNIEETWKSMNEKIKRVQTEHNLSDAIIYNEFFNDFQAGVSMSRKLSYDIGGFDERFDDKSLGLDKYGGEDIVFYHHLKNLGTKNIVNPKAKAIHVYHPKDGQGNAATTYAWKYVSEHPDETKSNIGKEWGLIEENGFKRVF